MEEIGAQYGVLNLTRFAPPSNTFFPPPLLCYNSFLQHLKWITLFAKDPLFPFPYSFFSLFSFAACLYFLEPSPTTLYRALILSLPFRTSKSSWAMNGKAARNNFKSSGHLLCTLECLHFHRATIKQAALSFWRRFECSLRLFPHYDAN